MLRCEFVAKKTNWAKGLTADTDPRVARMAAARRGKPNWARGLTAATDERIRRNAESRRGRPRGPYQPRLVAEQSFDPLTRIGPDRLADYAYLLGLYLGDGAIVSKTNRLEIFLDARYPALIGSCLEVMRRLHPRGCASVRKRGEGCRAVSSYAWQWPMLIPQHGHGRKHLRRIALLPWQAGIVARHPFSLLRGLIESDGGRFDRVVNSIAYPAYEFTNESPDIREIFCSTARAVGLWFTLPKKNVISIARRQHVATLDGYVPPKDRAS